MVNTEIRLIIFFAAKDGEALYSQQKQDLWAQELTVAQILNSLLSNSDFYAIPAYYVKAVYCHPAYLTYIQNTSCEMLG